MTEQEKQTPDVETSATPKTEPATPPRREQPPRHGLWLLIAAWLITLAGLGVGGVYAYQQLHQQQTELQDLQQKLGQLQQQQPLLQESAQQQQLQLKNLSDSQQAVGDKQSQLEKQLLSLQNRRPNDWILAEADYLVRMAGRKLWLEHDANATQLLLVEADNRLRDLNDPSLVPLRESVAKDLAKLKELPTIDREGLVLRIGALIDNVDQLTLAGVNPPAAVSEHSEDNQLSSELADWQSNLKKSWRSFTENFITIRRRDGNTEALIAPEQTWYLRENLKTRLLQAQLAVYREQQAVYDDSLSKSDKWVEQYFDPNDTTTQYMRSELAKLQDQNIVLSYPKQFQSQRQLEDLVHQRLQRLMP